MRKIYFAGAAAVLVAGSGVGLLWHGKVASALAETEARRAEVAAGPTVRVLKAKKSAPVRHLELQGEARPFASVTLYAKVSGYLKSISVDKGDRVREGQVVAVIESPEVDRQLDAALADAHYKRAEAQRAASLAGPGVVSARQAELEESQAHVAEAQVAALGTQKSYETLRAPFAGTVTARFADPGALVQNAANAQTSALPVVTISQIEKLRVYVYVDQRDAAAVKAGDRAQVRVPDRAVTRTGQVTRLARELDPKTRMMLVEIDLDNKDGALVPGSLVEVALDVAAPSLVEVPVGALLVRDRQPQVARLAGDVVRMVPVVVAEDDGAVVRLASGLDDGDEVAVDLGDAIGDGARVRPVRPGK